MVDFLRSSYPLAWEVHLVQSTFQQGTLQPKIIEVYGGFHRGYPNSWMVYFRENLIKIDDLGVSPFQETSILSPTNEGWTSIFCDNQQLHHPRPAESHCSALVPCYWPRPSREEMQCPYPSGTNMRYIGISIIYSILYPSHLWSGIYIYNIIWDIMLDAD